MTITVTPNPVPWSDQAVDGCTSAEPNRWAWSQTLENHGSTGVVFTQRINYFDGSQASAPTFQFTLSPGERYTHPTRWCSALSGDHTFRTDWVTSTGARITGPTVQLQRR